MKCIILVICVSIAYTLEASPSAHKKNHNVQDLVQNHVLKSQHAQEERLLQTKSNELQAIGGKCYFFSQKLQRDFNGALSYCQSNNMRLASLETKQDNNEVNNLLGAINYHTTFGNRIWTSGHRSSCNSNIFIWEGVNSAITYSRWANGEPNDVGGVEDCIELIRENGNDFFWNDANCGNVQSFLCEGPCSRP